MGRPRADCRRPSRPSRTERTSGSVSLAFLPPPVHGLLDESIENLARHCSRWTIVDRAEPLGRKFRLASFGYRPVRFLLGIGQLRIAKAGERGGLKQRSDKLLVAGE